MDMYYLIPTNKTFCDTLYNVLSRHIICIHWNKLRKWRPIGIIYLWDKFLCISLSYYLSRVKIFVKFPYICGRRMFPARVYKPVSINNAPMLIIKCTHIFANHKKN